MSTTIWTPDGLLRNATLMAGACWRVVEAQHHVSTAKLTDTAGEQNRLEELIESTKPAVPNECAGLNYLLFTPFRYGAVYPRGSRFRRAGMTPGVFYASETSQTAIAEMAFHRLLFFAESPNTPWPQNAGEYSALSANYHSRLALDLTTPPLNRHRKLWTHKINYGPCQDLADTARSADISTIKYESVRCPDRGKNIAILNCRAFSSPEIGDRQTWRIQLGSTGARLICEFPKVVRDIDPTHSANDPRIEGMNWNR